MQELITIFLLIKLLESNSENFHCDFSGLYIHTLITFFNIIRGESLGIFFYHRIAEFGR